MPSTTMAGLFLKHHLGQHGGGRAFPWRNIGSNDGRPVCQTSYLPSLSAVKDTPGAVRHLRCLMHLPRR